MVKSSRHVNQPHDETGKEAIAKNENPIEQLLLLLMLMQFPLHCITYYNVEKAKRNNRERERERETS